MLKRLYLLWVPIVNLATGRYTYRRLQFINLLTYGILIKKLLKSVDY